MHFQKTILASIAFLAAGGSAMAIATAKDLSSKDIVQTLDSITKKTADAKDKAASLTLTNAVTTGPAVVAALKDIVEKIANQTSDIKDSAGTKFTGSDKDNICSSLHSLIPGQKDFVEAIDGKKSAVSSTPFAAPIGAALKALESAIDSLMSSINDVSPDCENFKDDKKDLDDALEKVVDTYN